MCLVHAAGHAVINPASLDRSHANLLVVAFLTGRLLSTSGSPVILDTQRRLGPTRQVQGMNFLDHNDNSMQYFLQHPNTVYFGGFM